MSSIAVAESTEAAAWTLARAGAGDGEEMATTTRADPGAYEAATAIAAEMSAAEEGRHLRVVGRTEEDAGQSTPPDPTHRHRRPCWLGSPSQVQGRGLPPASPPRAAAPLTTP